METVALPPFPTGAVVLNIRVEWSWGHPLPSTQSQKSFLVLTQSSL